MGDELNQFQMDLLDSVREMNIERALRMAEVTPLADIDFDANVSSSTAHHKNASQQSNNSDASTSGE
ncbi:hypothetical protein BK659_05000 [Pseudomonas brassicacearum]|uniref:Uncharacterized protein n=1 Tax=Pseudomonas brassicacearum TaxID=930166 RepID=A0A423HCH2_9PSED|nr:hypothetical protein [Pseudomonas brassicacearum]RON10872.1 hypothetical protein BK659_05000 [Pseudomonas brassicacearum]